MKASHLMQDFKPSKQQTAKVRQVETEPTRDRIGRVSNHHATRDRPAQGILGNRFPASVRNSSTGVPNVPHEFFYARLRADLVLAAVESFKVPIVRLRFSGG